MKENRSAAIAAAIILLGFGLLAFYMPAIMVAAGKLSPYAAAAVAVIFMLVLFVVLWLRAQSQRRRHRE